MKRLCVFLGLFLVSFTFFFGVVSAQTYQCGADQTILRLSAETNAHAEIYNGAGNYPKDICYNEIFGKIFDDDGNPDNNQNCAGNGVLRLSANTNAHAERLNQGNYNVDVCFGDLVCTARTGACQGTEREIVSLSSDTNAHIEVANKNNYGTIICCSSAFAGGGGGIGDFNSAEWRDKNGQTRIYNANNGSTVTLYTTSSFENGQNIIFEVWDDDNGNGARDIGDDNVGTSMNAQVSGGIASVQLLITADMVEDANDGNDCGIGGGLEFYFDALGGPDNKKITSGKMTVDCKEDDSFEGKITAPVHQGVYFTGKEITFEQDYGSDDDFDFLWKITGKADKNTDTFGITFGINEVGEKIVTLRVTDSEGKWTEEQRAILVVSANKKENFAFINQPFHLQLVSEKTNTGGDNRYNLTIDYAANDSYVLQVSPSGECPGVICLAGNCPSETESVPNGCTDADGKLIINGYRGWAKTNWTWIFDQDSNFSIENAGFRNTYEYGRNEAGERLIKLIFGYNNPSNGIFITKEVTRTFNLGQCQNNGQTWYDINDANGLPELPGYDTRQPNGACVGPDGDVDIDNLNSKVNNDNCCFGDWVCGDPLNTGDRNQYKCYDTTEDDNIQYCSDYTNELACENYNEGILKNHDDYDREPKCGERDDRGNLVECGCEWIDVNDDTNFQCEFFKDTNPSFGGGSNADRSRCSYDYEYGECESGYRTIDLDATFYCGNNVAGDGEVCEDGYNAEEFGCVDETRTILCGAPSIDLGFFGWKQFVISLIGIFLAYSIIHHGKKRK